MPRHAFRFPPHVRDAVRRHVEKAVHSVDANRYKQEHAYCAALARALEGVAYDGPDGHVEFRSTVVSDRGKGSAESWSGADLAITADVSDGAQHVRKAILIQAKLGALADLPPRQAKRLRDQIADMAKHTRSPKVMDIPRDEMDIPRDEGDGDPGIYSGNLYRSDENPSRYRLADYIVQRVLTTLDGDTRASFVDAVQDSDLTTLKVIARRKA